MSEKIILPVIPLRGLTILPGTTVHFDISRKTSIAAAKGAMLEGRKLFVVAQKDPVEEAPGFDGIYKVGTVVEVKQLNKLPDNIVRVMVEAKKRGRIYSLYENGKRLDGEIEIMPEPVNQLTKNQEEAFVRELKEAVKQFDGTTHELTTSGLKSVLNISELKKIMQQILLRVKIDYISKQEFLESDTIVSQFTTVMAFLVKENEIGEIRGEIIEKVKKRLDKSQREHILREQIQVIREELGDDFMADAEELEKKIMAMDAENFVKDKLLKELSRFKTYAGNAVEGNVIRNYIETVLELARNKVTKENPDIKNGRDYFR